MTEALLQCFFSSQTADPLDCFRANGLRVCPVARLLLVGHVINIVGRCSKSRLLSWCKFLELFIVDLTSRKNDLFLTRHSNNGQMLVVPLVLLALCFH